MIKELKQASFLHDIMILKDFLLKIFIYNFHL